MIIQPNLQRFVHYDGYGRQPENVVPVISDWLDWLYTTLKITPATPVKSWPIICPTDAPKQYNVPLHVVYLSKVSITTRLEY